MRKSLVSVAVTIVGVLGMSAPAQAQEGLPPCPPGTANPGYCEVQPLPPCPPGATNPGYCEAQPVKPTRPSKAVRRSAKFASKRARVKLRTRGALVHLLRRKRIRFAAVARTPGRYRMRLVVRTCGKRVLVARGFRRVTGSGRVILGLRTTKAGRTYLRRKTYRLGLRPRARRPGGRNRCKRRLSNRRARQRFPRMALVVRFQPDEGAGYTERKRALLR